MKRILYLILLFASLGATTSYAQTTEICANSIDDDGDGKIDCFDGDCVGETVCTGGYIGGDLKCEAKPSAFPKFSLALESASENGTAIHLGRIAVGDIDRDGKPEMITTNQYSKKIFILNGENVAGVNKIQAEKTVSYSPAYTDILIANIDNDNCAEIYVISTGNRLRLYDCNLNELKYVDMPSDPGMMGVADFNGDGKVELYARNAIYDAHTLDVIVAPSKWADTDWPAGEDDKRPNGGPVAVDILNDATGEAHLPTDAIKDDNLELIVGGTIYSVDIAGKKITEVKSISNFRRKLDSDATSVADFNLDGSLDVIASGKNDDNDYTTIFFWDVKAGVVKTYADPIAGDFTIKACPTNTGKYYEKGWHRGTGRVNIADLDGDGKLNLAYVSGKFLYALKEDMTLFWKVEVNEETSGNTGCTLFDFNGDGQSEIVYRDEKFVYIINGTNGSVFTQQPCVSRTNREYPIVADVDADGNTELCVTCRYVDFVQNGTITDPNDANYLKADEDNFCEIKNSEFSHVRVFRSGGEPWVPARRVWNQHGYFNVNVNDNLTIPKVQQKHHIVFSENVCTTGKNRPLNSFLNQSPFLNSLGCPKYASPDLGFVQNSLTVETITCPQTDFKISFQITNLGDVSLSGTVPITFYNGDPRPIGTTAEKLNTVDVVLNDLKKGSVQSITNANVEGPGSPFTLYIVLNDNGTTLPLKLPNTNFIECDYGNNVLSRAITPELAPLTALKIQDNIKCEAAAANNGGVRAYVPDGGGENITDYTFYWTIGKPAKPVASADHIGATFTKRAGGTYTVYAIHNTAKCYSQTKEVVLKDSLASFKVTIEQDALYDNCKNPNAKLRAIVNDDKKGDNVGKYTFTWYKGNDVFGEVAGTGHVANGLDPISYTVQVTDKATLCKTIETFTIQDDRVKPTVTTSKSDIACSATATGSASAKVNNAVAGYTFEWYNGDKVKASPDFTGADYTGLTDGKYTVVATSNSSKCSSNPVTVTITRTVPPVVTASVITHQTSCDATKPNGSASAHVANNTTDYTFEWFEGQNTLLTNRVATTSTATGLKANTKYTVKATNKDNGCSDTEEVTINFAVVTPTLTLASSSHATKCDPANGSITVSVNPGTPSDYTFSWYKDAVDATPDFTDDDETLSGIPAGTYYVKAVFDARHCETAPLKVVINNIAPVISFNPTNVIRPSDCNDNSGELTVSVSAPGNTLGFDFEWRKGQEPYAEGPITTVSHTLNSSTASSLVAGVYTLIATNRETGCSTSKPFNLPFDDAQVLSYVNHTNVNNCVPGNNGSAEILLTPTAGYLHSDYRIYVYKGKNDLVTPGLEYAWEDAVHPQANYDWSGLEPGFYTFVAVTTNPARGTFNCRSVPVTLEIEKNTTDPTFTGNPSINNVNCVGSAGTGQLSITITNPTDYSYAWYEGPDASSPALGTNTSGTSSGATASALQAGKYTVVVTKTAGNSAGCFSMATYQIFDNTPVLSIAQADIALTDITRCDAMTAGEAIVNFVTQGGAQMPAGNPPGNFDFEWYTSSASGPQLINGVTTNTLSNQPAGTYYVKAINNVSSCTTAGLVEFKFEDKTMNTVGVDLMAFVVPTQCLKPANDQGSLEVLAFGNGASYTYTWYSGKTTADPFLTNGVLAQNLAPGFYTVEVLNNTTQCKITDTYELPLDVRPIAMSASAEPLTVCFDTSKDGSVFATVTRGDKNDYAYEWHLGTVKPTADFTSTPLAIVSNLGVGNYIVKITDLADAGCVTSDTVRVDDGRVFPKVTAEPLAPLTICDPTRPDGVASANVDGDILYHRFEWYNNAPPSGTSFFTGSHASGLNAGLFSVVGINEATGCSDTTQVNIEIKQVPIPIPQIEVLSMVTSCISNNGSLTASVNGVKNDHIFNWYVGNTEKASPDFVGEIYDSLSIGLYSVTATSKITGCKSPLATDEIIDSPKYPDFSITTVPTVCREDSSEPGTGFAALFMTNSVDTDSIIWRQNDIVFATGPLVSNLDAGLYEVTVISSLGCETTKSFEVKTEIRPFNGISRNGDGQNDMFHINCIESFPSNVVKIFNRAGTMVYEAQGYDNNGTYFDGQSNKGVSIMGTNLPGGTYFYIIDKRDGSKPVAGYLEIVN